GRLQGVRDPRAVVVALRVDEDLRLPLEPPEGLGMDDPVAVALKRGSQIARLLVDRAAAGLVRTHGERRQPRLLVLSDSLLECLRRAPCDLHGVSVVAAADRPETARTRG